MIEHESLQRAAAREQPGVLEHESIQRAAAREQPGVLEHEIILNCIMYYCGQLHSFDHKSQ